MNLSNPYTQRTVSEVIDVFGLADPQATVQVNGATASCYGSYFHQVVSVDNSASAQYPEITIQAGNNSVTRHAFVPKDPEVFEYDADGNLTQGGRWTYEWNGENRLIRMTTRSDVPGPHYQLTFQYDWMGRRIRKTVVNLHTGQTISDLIFLYDGWNLIAEVNAQTGNLIRTYVWGPDLSGTMQGAGGIGGLLWVNLETGSHAGRYFAAYDGNGNVMGLVSASEGSVVAQYEYGPFAEPLRATGLLTADNPFRFSTKYTDTETGLVYYGYRYYDPFTGRWLNGDLIGEEGGQNLYGFVYNRPISWIDSDGKIPIEGPEPSIPPSAWPKKTPPSIDCSQATCLNCNGKPKQDLYPKKAHVVCKGFAFVYTGTGGQGAASCVADCLVDAEKKCQAKWKSCDNRNCCRLVFRIHCYVKCGFVPYKGLPPGADIVGWKDLIPSCAAQVTKILLGY